MAKCVRPDAVGFRLWPALSPAALRRRLLEAVACGASRHRTSPRSCSADACGGRARRPRPPGTERLMELIQADSSESDSDEAADAETQRKIEALEELQRVVSRLQIGEKNTIVEAAAEVRRLAKADPEARETLAMLGAIPPLVGMLDSDDSNALVAALYALLNLGIGNEFCDSRNKGAIVKAGAVHKMLNLMECGKSSSVSEAIVANFLGLSALDFNKPIIGASGAIPFLLTAFQSPKVSATVKQDALRALFNLSLASANLPLLIDAGLVPVLLTAIGDMAVTDRALAVLSNIVSVGEGRRAVGQFPDSFAILLDVLGWSDATSCQEKSVYVLMVMAHKGHRTRAATIEAGAISALLELTLLGTPLAQKRASRLLEMLTVGKGKGLSAAGSSSAVPAVSAPLCSGSMEVEGAEVDDAMSEERRAVKDLVQQSLQSNMRRIARRANLPQDFAPSERLRALTTTSTSKSLPF